MGQEEKDVETEVERWKDKWMKLIGPQTLQHCLCLSFALCPSSKSWMQKAQCSTTAVIALSLSGFEPLSLIHTKRMIQKVFAANSVP